METNSKPDSGKSYRTTALISVLLIIVVVQGIKIYLDYQEKSEVKQQLVTTETDLAGTMQRLNDVKSELMSSLHFWIYLAGSLLEVNSESNWRK